MTSIVDFYADRSIFMTGATGFMGKVLLEKLLHSCPSIRCIYVLIRPKKGLSVGVRLAQLLESKLFDSLRTDVPEFYSKVVPVCGDILECGLGLCSEDFERIIKEVSIVFHSAATVKFDEPLKFSVNMNVVGVSQLVELCRNITHLKALVHISTAYANCDRQVIHEVIYPAPLSPAKVISAMEWMSDDMVESLTAYAIAPRPNTYTFTKAIAETLLSDLCTAATIPCAIVRPSIVGASWQHPIPGWVDNFNGPSGLLAAIGKGMLRVMMGDSSGCADIIPVDLAVNLIIAAAWSIAMEPCVRDRVQVFNCTTGQLNRLTWGQVEKASYSCYMRTPLDSPVRLPQPKFTTSRVYFELHRWFDHFLPAWLMDIGLSILGKKPVLWHLQQRLWRSVSSLQYFTTHQWTFDTTNVTQLLTRMSEDDLKAFNFDVRRIHWPTYLENYCIGVKRYALKEDLTRLPQARQALQRLVLRKRVKYVIVGVTMLFLLRYSVSGNIPRSMLMNILLVYNLIISRLNKLCS